MLGLNVVLNPVLTLLQMLVFFAQLAHPGADAFQVFQALHAIPCQLPQRRIPLRMLKLCQQGLGRVELRIGTGCHVSQFQQQQAGFCPLTRLLGLQGLLLQCLLQLFCRVFGIF